MNRTRLLRRVVGAWRVAHREPPAPIRVSVDRLAPAESARLRVAVTDALACVRPPGAQLAVRRRGTLLWAACAGRVDRSAPVAEQDRFVLASTTKLATACLVAMLAERGELGLDDPVGRWMPELPHADRLTPRLLLAHRSGLREYGRDRALARRLNGSVPDYPWSRDEVVEAIVRLGPERDPDKRFAYRNSNYVVAAELVERASGHDFSTLLDELVAGPLGLPGFSCATSVRGTRLATPHASMLLRPIDLLAVTGGLIPTDALGPIWGDGGIASSALDLARFTEALFTGELVSAQTLGAMVTRNSRFGRKAGYGLGVMTSRIPGAVVAGHDGLYFGMDGVDQHRRRDRHDDLCRHEPRRTIDPSGSRGEGGPCCAHPGRGTWNAWHHGAAMGELELTRTAGDRRLYALADIGTVRLKGWGSRAPRAEAKGRTWEIARRWLWRPAVAATDETGTAVGQFRERGVRRGGPLSWSDRELTLRPTSRWRERYALADGDHDLAVFEGKGWGRRPVTITVDDLRALDLKAGRKVDHLRRSKSDPFACDRDGDAGPAKPVRARARRA